MPLLIEPEQLASRLEDGSLMVLDARFSLTDPGQGQMMYNREHIPGALYADMERDLSGPVISGKTGRHPLPELKEWQVTLRRWGIDKHSQVVVYDDGVHAMAARAWWLLRWAGVSQAMILHGGMKAWQEGCYPVTALEPEVTPSQMELSTAQMPTVSAANLMSEIDDPGTSLTHTLIDARSYERFRGEGETIDPIAGHIPGAICHPFTENLDNSDRFLPADHLRDIFTALIGDDPQPVFYCGSGITACHNIFAMALAGLPGATLYPGSWSEWITDPRHPVAGNSSSF